MISFNGTTCGMKSRRNLNEVQSSCKMESCRRTSPLGISIRASRVDEVAIYNRSLSASEITSHYNRERMRYEFIISNSSGFAASDLTPNRGVTKMALNNFSQPQYYDDEYTLLVEHFDSLAEIGWNNGTVYGNFSICDGKFGPGGCFDGDNSYVEVLLPE